MATGALAALGCLGYLTVNATYALTGHPLAGFPGPSLCAFSRLPFWIQVFQGTDVQWIHQLHRYYGPVVRYGPNDLSYLSAQSWRDIYGRPNGRPTLPRTEDFAIKPWNGVPSILTCDDENHARVRRIFSPAFSERALRQQEPLFQKYTKLLLETMENDLKAGEKLEMTRFLTFTTFDIMADLCFGHPLELLSRNQWSPWVSAIFDMIRMLHVSMLVDYYPILGYVVRRLEPRWLRDMKSTHFKHSADRVDQRLKEGTEKPDFWNLIIKTRDSGDGLSLDEMHSNAEVFMLAGTETTATLLAGLLYYLCLNQKKLQLLVQEIRTAYSTMDDITFDSLSKLEYLRACIKEALRMYPPGPAGSPRLVPGDGHSIEGRWVSGGTRVVVSPYAAYRSEINFADPDTFAPERWLNADHAEADTTGKFAGDKGEALQPFSVGPRNCIGQSMAHHEARLILAALLLRFDFELCEESKAWADQKAHALWLKKPLLCRVTQAV
ncbi:cytochrome P450 [Microdochium trichocladiopsis]|uniref:Cytochrome P450 n=1 Tax=Microdochium trichocladiopsis TaxID=1682393 RepID=A0A9P9BK81_9PEZI|nr:cytochrome P450 [Microdochium trichocladiopsis]KAH7009126.1 cytochrome P450 [Microdochium trichocladiopsis]